jgi:large subunit ribosomal protein L7A
MLPDLKNIKSKVVGTSQVLRALNSKRAKTVYIAQDANHRVVASIYHLCEESRIPVVKVESMRTLGAACGIRVGAAAAALVE